MIHPRPSTRGVWRRHLSPPQAVRLLVAAAAQAWFVVALHLRPLAGLARRATDGQVPARATSVESAEPWVRAVQASARLLGSYSTCLSRAFAAHWLLARRGRRSAICIGVAPARPGPALDAHAWLESDGAVLLGERAPGTYREVIRLEMIRR